MSQHARDLVADMLHVAPQRRPTAAQLVKHPWVNMRAYQVQGNQMGSVITQSQSFYNQNYMSLSDISHKKEGPHLKEAVAATFRAIATSPQVAHLGPVAMSELARRRFRDKALNRLQHT